MRVICPCVLPITKPPPKRGLVRSGRELDDLDEDDGEGEEGEGLDEGETKDEHELNARACSWVARHRFGGGTGHATLSEGAEASGERHGEAGGEGDPVGVVGTCSGVATGGLCVHRHRQHEGEDDDEHHCFLHCLFLLVNRCQWVVAVHRADRLTLYSVVAKF